MGEHERIVIGAGPAGCAVALRLAAAGQRPLLLERSRAVRPRLCGEFVGAEAAAALAALGVDVAALGGRETRHLRLACGRQCIETELPFTAFGLSRAALDAALQARACTLQACRCGAAREPPARGGHGAAAVPAVRDDAGRHGGGAAHAQPAARLRQDRSRPTAAPPAPRARKPVETAPRTIFRVPYGDLHPACAADPPGLWRLGDQAAVIPSFTGDGVAIALHSAAVAAEELLAGASPLHYHRRLQRELRAQMARATTLYRIGRRQPTRALLLDLLQRLADAGWVAGGHDAHSGGHALCLDLCCPSG